ncbi:MAG: putative Ig domain-containing protein [Bacteroidetes bacterium]|nr:putative Ig domain-containing protein [Bacteroidota bacterium]
MKLFLLVFFALGVIQHSSVAQQRLVTDFSSTMQIPDIVNMKASATHLYVLSESEGLIVFRTNTDTLQWILTSEGMTTRGTQLHADIRFAYLFGAGNRLTVLEPTSLLGVYSSTFLQSPPLAVARSGTDLFVAMGEQGIGQLSLATPAAFDNEPVMLDTHGVEIIALKRTPTQLVAMGAERELQFWDIDGDQIRLGDQVQLDRDANRLHIINDVLFVSDDDGTIFEVRSTGQTIPFTAIGEGIDTIQTWGDQILVRTVAGRLIGVESDGSIHVLRDDTAAGNFFALAQRNLWVSNYSEVAKNSFVSTRATTGQTNGTFRLTPVENIVVPFPRPVIFSLNVEGASPGSVRFQLQSEVSSAEIRGNGFFLQPASSEIGVNRFVVTATNTDGITQSTTFTVDVRAFNAPPRFNPIRPMSVVVGENFQLPIRAVDPDGIDRELIRYHGVDLPDGAIISERTGMFTWTPDRRQVGNHQFQVIATDQFGAATSQNVSITVRNLQQDGETGNGF